jgi:hypothetical protein
MFEECLQINHKDGPTIALLDYIESNNCICPAKWECRELLEKWRSFNINYDCS